MDARKTLISSGVHIGAIRRLGDSYSADEYLAAVEAAQAAGVAEDGGEATVRAAESLLRGRGVDPAKASYREFAAALVEVSE